MAMMNGGGLQPASSRRREICSVFFAGLACLFLAGGCNRVDPVRGEVFVHDPSTIVKWKDEYWFFATGNGIRSRHSKDFVKWTAGPPVFPTLPAWTSQIVPGNRGYFWAPDIIRAGDRFLLYYSISKWGANTSAIGLATNTTLDPSDKDYYWKDCGIVVHSGARDKFNAIDPCVTLDADGKLWLAFGSFWSGIKLVQLNIETGKRMASGSPVYSLASHSSIEAPYIYKHGDYYFLFVNWGFCCRGVKSTYNVRVGRSTQITGPYLDKAGSNMLHEGGSNFLNATGTFIGPGQVGILTEGGNAVLSYHYYDANNHGKATLRTLSLQWDSFGWPFVSDQSAK
jgi:arabinan endo-1,5-alpha-L-arabinosidase